MIIEKNSCTLSRKSVQKVFGGDFFSFTACRRVKQACFTMIELLVITAQHCRHFIKRFVCTDKYGCVRKHTENAALKNMPHHTCKASASCLPQANASYTAHNAVFASAKTYSLFLKGEWGLGESENLLFS